MLRGGMIPGGLNFDCRPGTAGRPPDTAVVQATVLARELPYGQYVLLGQRGYSLVRWPWSAMHQLLAARLEARTARDGLNQRICSDVGSAVQQAARSERKENSGIVRLLF